MIPRTAALGRWLPRRLLPMLLPPLAMLLLAVQPARAVEVQRVVSPGGIEAWFVQDSTVPVTSIEFSFRGGSALDPADKAGLSAMTAALLDEGAGEFDSLAFHRRVEDLALRLGFSAGNDTIRGSFKALNVNLDESVELLRLALTRPRFDEEPVERVRGQFLAGYMQRIANPNYVASRTWWRAVFPEHPYGLPDAGTPETIKAIEAGDMRGRVERYFAKENLIVGAVGDIDPERLGAVLDRAFGGLPDKAAAVVDIKPAALRGEGKVYVVERDLPQSVVVFGERGVQRNDPDFYIALVMNHILGGGGFTSRLYTEVREKRGLAYSVHTGLETLKHAALLVGKVSTESERVGESVEIIRQEWARMRDKGVTEAELADAKKFLTGSFPLSLSSSDQIARILVAMRYFDLGIDYLDRYDDYIEAVTQEDVARLAEQLLDPEKLTVVVVGKPKGIVPNAPAPEIGG